jgi:LysM repeat protein/ABC-type branched-subunit amino acid transport system substrate-binding protein
MKLFISICLFAVFVLNAQRGFSQKETEISGVKYQLYLVKKGETAFSICQQFKITQAELKKANPDLPAVIKAGYTLKIPLKKEVAEKKPDQTSIKTVAAEPEYYYHKVTKKQTIFSIAKQYGITANELIRYNTEITNGLIPGQVLKVPVRNIETKNTSAQPEVRAEDVKLPTSGSLEKYKVEKGETLFSLASRFGVEVDDLKKANPSLLSRGLEAGETIFVPKYTNKAITEEKIQKPIINEIAIVAQDIESSNCNPISGNNIQKYKVGLLLPFYLPGNDQINLSELKSELLLSKIDFSKTISNLPVITSDSVAVINGINIDQRAQSFLEFYEGALLAIDSLQQKGMNIELYVFDASNNKMINGLLQLDVFRELNLIIGPVYPELQENIASFAAKNRIPMVSPLASTGNFEENNPYFFKVNPTREYQIEQTAQYIADEFSNKNFFLLPMSGNSNSAEAKLAELSKTKLFAARQLANNRKDLFHEYSFQNQGLNPVKSLLDDTGENIFIIPTDNEAQVSVAVTNLNALAENYDVVLIGTSNLAKLKSIQTENYHHIRLRYLSPTFTDYTKPLVRRFINQYRETFSGEPSQFSYQGFDVSYYFLSALYRYGKDFRNCLPQYPMELTQMDFSFRRVTPMGGFMNNGLFVTAYERNYDVLKYGTTVSGQK